MEPEKRLSLPEWQDNITSIKTNFDSFIDVPTYSPFYKTIQYEAIEAYHKQEIAFLQSQIDSYKLHSVSESLPNDGEQVYWVEKYEQHKFTKATYKEENKIFFINKATHWTRNIPQSQPINI